MKKEFKRIKDLSREIVGEEHFKKIKKIKDYGQRTESLKYLVDSKLKLRLLELESKLKEVENKDSWVLESKLKLLESKIRIFQSTYSRRDYDSIKKILDDLEEELKNV